MNLAERRPASNRWRPWNARRLPAIAASCWVHPSGVRVISGLEDAEYPDGSGERGPQWHISIARPGKRPTAADVELALRAFDMVGTEEDNHHPGNARHFWLPVDPARRVGCECKVTEITVTDADGYQWTNPRDGVEPCRGCEIAPILGRPCPLHGAEARP